jgi:Tol biopolymer transport system component
LELAGRDLVWAAAVQPPGPESFEREAARVSGGSFPGASHKMVFSRFLDGDWDIFTMNPDGSGLVNLTNQIPLDAHPAWNADSTLIAFASTRDRHNEIYTMNPDGTNVQRLTNNDFLDSEPSWSPEGTRIAMRSSRDGNNEIYVMNADGTEQTNLTNSPAEDAEPDWSPAGDRVAFQSDRKGTLDLFSVNADGSGLTRITRDPLTEGEPSWSPDGQKLAYVGTLGNQGEIFTVNADGTNKVRLTNNSFLDDSPVWSPDGTRIGFISEREGNLEIYTMNSDGTGVTRVSFDGSPDRMPDWGSIPEAHVDVTVEDFSFSPRRGRARPGQTVRWNFAGPSDHTVTDASGLGLFGSGPEPSGGAYAFTFPAAGRYPYSCTIHPFMRGAVAVPVLASPREGALTTSFDISWASGSPPRGFVFDVQVQRPGTMFVDWKVDGILPFATFVPDAGKGTYSFRARMRNVASSVVAGYSEPASVTVG